jgi:hypothetical protein
LLDAVTAAYPQALIAGFGSDMAVLKGVGHPRALTEAWGLAKAQGWQGVGHTRMATESAVTPAGCHPYAVGPEQCMVHNGSFANHATIRRELRAAGVQFDSDNDTEVGARFIAKQLAGGRDVEAAEELCATFDGFYTPTAVQPRLVRGGARRDRVQARRHRRDRRLGGDGQRIPCAGRASRRRGREDLGAGAGGDLRMEQMTATKSSYDLRTTPLREVNAILHAPDLSGEFVIAHPEGAHNVAVGIELR